MTSVTDMAARNNLMNKLASRGINRYDVGAYPPNLSKTITNSPKDTSHTFGYGMLSARCLVNKK